ncbi:unnamed protein product [Heterosigma akashiwo]
MDLRSGQGKFTSVDQGEYYEGAWLEGFKHGVGKLTLNDGNHFVGSWKRGSVDGKVEFVFNPKSPWNDPEY